MNCPIRELSGTIWESAEVGNSIKPNYTQCVEAECAWWVARTGECAMHVLGEVSQEFREFTNRKDAEDAEASANRPEGRENKGGEKPMSCTDQKLTEEEKETTQETTEQAGADQQTETTEGGQTEGGGGAPADAST